MQPKKKLQTREFEWLAVVVLLASQVGATEQAASSQGPASDAATLAVTPGCHEVLSPRLSDLERRLFDKIHDGHFGRFSLLQAGLIAGGVDGDDELRRYCRRFDTFVESLRRSGKVRGTPRERAQAVFAFLHQSILRGGYNLQASDLRQTFDHGRFNCVTASILFNCLAERFELKAVGLEIPGHAMSRLELPAETLDIETTCSRWFALLDRRSRADLPQAVALAESRKDTATPIELAEKSPAVRQADHDHDHDHGYMVPDMVPEMVPEPDHRRAAPGHRGMVGGRRQVSEVELVATIYYNRGVDLLAEKRFADAAAANAKALRLDPQNATAKGNFLATINNWAIDLGTSGEYEQAAELLRLGLAIDPSYDAVRANYVQLFRQWSEDLCGSGRYDDAVRLLTQASKDQPGEKFFREAAIEVLRRWAGR